MMRLLSRLCALSRLTWRTGVSRTAWARGPRKPVAQLGVRSSLPHWPRRGALAARGHRLGAHAPYLALRPGRAIALAGTCTARIRRESICFDGWSPAVRPVDLSRRGWNSVVIVDPQFPSRNDCIASRASGRVAYGRSVPAWRHSAVPGVCSRGAVRRRVRCDASAALVSLRPRCQEIPSDAQSALASRRSAPAGWVRTVPGHIPGRVLREPAPLVVRPASDD